MKLLTVLFGILLSSQSVFAFNAKNCGFVISLSANINDSGATEFTVVYENRQSAVFNKSGNGEIGFQLAQTAMTSRSAFCVDSVVIPGGSTVQNYSVERR